MASAIIPLPDGGMAFVDGLPETCDHDFSIGVVQFWNDPRTMTETEYHALPDEEKQKLSISTGQGMCSKCGALYLDVNNPFMMDF